MKKWQALIMPPRYLAGVAVLLLAVLFGATFFELRHQKAEVQHLMHEEASLLIQSIALGAENAIVAYDEIKAQLAERLLNSLRLLDRLERQKPLTAEELSRIADQNGLYRVNMFDKNGERIASSHPQVHTDVEQIHDPKDVLGVTRSRKMKALAATFALLCLCYMAMAEEHLYTVQKDDTLEKIAQTQLDDAKLWPQLAEYNSLDDPDLIKEGQRIVIPSQSQLLLSSKAKSKLQARITALEQLVHQYQGFPGELMLTDNFEARQLATKPAGWRFPSGGKWGISALASWVLSQTARKAGNSAAVSGKPD